MIEPPGPDCWLHPDIDIRPSMIAGRGLHARVGIAAGTVVSRLGGRLVTRRELEDLLAAAAQPGGRYLDTITAGADGHLVLPAGTPNGLGNHSCDPNLWWVGPYELAARRDVAEGEELTNDYATSTADPGFTMHCRCGAVTCRRIVSGDDWRRPELWERYGEHWVPAVVALMRSIQE
jgi:hypothetical protein